MFAACFRSSFVCALAIAFGYTPKVHAQWLTQSIELKAGWNAVYLHVDSSHATLTDLIGADANNPIQEVWLWNASASVAQFVTSPQQPIHGGTHWIVWTRAQGIDSALQRLSGNVACLVRVDSGSATYGWNLKGKPVPPQYQWTTTGLNFLGFPTPSVNPPSFEDFLAKTPSLTQGAEIYRYPGGELGAGNPMRIFEFRTTSVRRGEAFWMRAGTTFNRYFGPFDVELQSTSGVHFGNNLGQYRIRLRNVTSAQVTVTLNVLPSETPPSGQAGILQIPPLLVRGAFDAAKLTYAYTELNAGAQSWVLAAKGQPGSDAELILGLNRSVMAGNPNDLYAGILRLTDSLGYSQVDLPVSANPSSSSGLWVGNVIVNQVRHYLKNYQRNADNEPVLAPGSSQYAVVSTNQSLGTVARPFNLRLIVHKGAAETRLFQRLYHGLGLGTNAVVTTSEDLLHPSLLSSARRISAVHLPHQDGNTGWLCSGQLAQGQTLTAQVNLGHGDSASNPFLHSFHPDHDNLNATFDGAQPRGAESYDVERKLTLTFTAPGNDFTSLVSGAGQLTGLYSEEITLKGRGEESRRIDTAGVFLLKRISDISTLTTQ